MPSRCLGTDLYKTSPASFLTSINCCTNSVTSSLQNGFLRFEFVSLNLEVLSIRRKGCQVCQDVAHFHPKLLGSVALPPGFVALPYLAISPYLRPYGGAPPYEPTPIVDRTQIDREEVCC